ncbi:alanine racemase [Alsobacter metallidurans]|uniref:Alanine racemase n=1 Tax=Alsobacter metallidurans TaxID=340221 RepID=A0A917MI97_9HYPH|nr:alanine racemase [Alsobacter metallidurans]GGH21700.1 alanine racemase [Alsobacter metallidurans]
MSRDPAASGPPLREAGGVLTVDLGALKANWRMLAGMAPGSECAAVVKADAYGTGIEASVPALARAGCRTFFVAHLAEARRARAAAPYADIYVLNGLLPGTAPAYATDRLRPVLGSAEEIAEWAAFTRAESLDLAAALHVDTGMNRLGLTVAQALEMGEAGLEGCPISFLMTHFVSAEEPPNPINARQIEDFATLRAAFPTLPGSLANSSGVFLGPQAHHDLMRPGYALYGGNPQPGRPNPMRPVVGLEGRIVQLRFVEHGDTVGYNAQWTARGRRRIAVISVGYADGYPRAASSSDAHPGADAMVGGVRCPFAGRVSMDLIAIDVTEAPGDLGRGDSVWLLCAEITVDDVAARAGASGYEILTSLGRRHARRYVD